MRIIFFWTIEMRIITEKRKKLRTFPRRYGSFEMCGRGELTSLCIKLEEYEEIRDGECWVWGRLR